MPGRINETWTRIHEKYAGKTIYGMCSELCGVNHGFMPIAILAVSKEEFEAWDQASTANFRIRCAAGSYDPGHCGNR